ncbi:gibberellin-regulated protein 11-like [Vigna unguiculata]|uniref:Gibberellin regulated protein n=1 Tax=Vigna unguiculata TaxID=3917 RepID=A0A4D6MG88_VIGUN|nr:gibberellin-regulated protein 11-like [Vigna unguiculata]QCD98794.1 Gibberellin regulated protein [Vigna unguiculata]
MTIFKTLLASILISQIIVILVESDRMVILNNLVAEQSPNPSPPTIDCDGECTRRCQLSSRPNLCKRACGTCCQRCNCVPSGTSGHYEECPCYANLTTHGGRHKCP